jgi:hypothetical protein
MLPWKNYFYTGLGSFLQSSEQNIRLQTNIGAGIGKFLKNTNNARISLLGGVAWQDTAYTELATPVPSQSLVAALVGTELKFFRFNKTHLDVDALAFPALSKPGRIFVYTNATYYVKITGDLSWNVSFYGNWDNQPPANFSGSDYGTSSGLTYSFGLK